MSRCEMSEMCSFFNNEIGNLPTLVRAMKRRYCQYDKEHCARYMVRQKLLKANSKGDTGELSAFERDISSMYPNDHPKAQRLMSRISN